MFQLRPLAFGAACALTLAAAPLSAETPQDSLVMAFQIDDLITLDPAEVFEFTGAEYAANVYDRLVTYPVITFHSGNPLTAEDAAWSLRAPTIAGGLRPGPEV